MMVLLSPENAGVYEAGVVNSLFDEGLGIFILRLPGKEMQGYTDFLDKINPLHRRKILVAAYHEQILERYAVGGFYCSNNRINQDYEEIAKLSEKNNLSLAVGLHDIDELDNLNILPTFALLSPVFTSISKRNYSANPVLAKIGDKIHGYPTMILAMGGIDSEKQSLAYQYGYDGVAVLGDIWKERGKEISAFRQYSRATVMSLAGIDPSCGAGIAADIKIANNYAINCVAIPLTLTIQSESEVLDVKPVDFEHIMGNIRINTKNRNIRIAKIGLAYSLKDILRIIIELQDRGVKYIVWDPIIKTTAGDYKVLKKDETFTEILKRLYLICPNIDEANELFGTINDADLLRLSEEYKVNILLKGGHIKDGDYSIDTLYRPGGKDIKKFMRLRSGFQKHGTGCMLSLSIISCLVMGYSLERAAFDSQMLISQLMKKSRGIIARLPIDIMRDKRLMVDRNYRLQYVTNTYDEDKLLYLCSSALKSGLRWIQLRMKKATTEERIRVAKKLRELTLPYSATLIIDDDIQAVIGADADGVHLGLEDMNPVEARNILGEDRIIGMTCNKPEHIKRAVDAGADYIGVGPFRMTYTKAKLAPILGVQGVKALLKYYSGLKYSMPMVVIGGITCNDISDLKRIGVEGFAISGEIERSMNVDETVENLINEIYRESDKIY